MAIDWPDWSKQVAGGLRYAGATPLSSGGAFVDLNVLPTTFERAILIHTPIDASGDWFIQVIGFNTGRLSTVVSGVGPDQWIIGYVNPALDPEWVVEVQNAGGANLYCDVFVDTALALTRVVNVPGQSLPVYQQVGPRAGVTSIKVALTTSATPGLIVSQSLAAAPGAGQRHRVWQAALTSSITGAAAVRPGNPVWVAVADQGSTIAATDLFINATSVVDRAAMVGGVGLPANTALYAFFRSTIASAVAQLQVLYTTEAA